MSSTDALQLGDIVAATWRVDSVLRKGPTGTVFLATDLKLGRRVAVKALTGVAMDTDAVARLEREAQLLAKLSHPNIVALHMMDLHEEVPYLVMQFLEGKTLAELVLERGGLPEREVLPIAEQVASALTYLHGQRLLHRDLKPSNLMVSPRGHVTLIDLGITRTQESALTRTGVVHGTPGYMSPEAILGERNLDGRADMYSLAAVLFELLTGSLPFGQLTGEALLRAHLTLPRPKAHELRKTLSPIVSTVLARAMALQPDGRYASVAEFQQAFRAALETSLAPGLQQEPVTAPREALSLEGEDSVTPAAGDLADRTDVQAAVVTGPMPALVAPLPPEVRPTPPAESSAPKPRPRPREVSGPKPGPRALEAQGGSEVRDTGSNPRHRPRDGSSTPRKRPDAVLAAQQDVAITPVGLKPLRRGDYPADEPSFLKRRAREVWGGVIGVALLLSLLAIFWPSGELVGPPPAEPLPANVLGMSTPPSPSPPISVPSTASSATAADKRAQQSTRPVVQERPRPQVRRGNGVPPTRLLRQKTGRGLATLLVSEAVIVATFNKKPVAALVEVDDIFRGQTPLKLTLPAGAHVVRLDYGQAAVTEFATEFAPGKSMRLEVELPTAKEAKERAARKREKHAH